MEINIILFATVIFGGSGSGMILGIGPISQIYASVDNQDSITCQSHEGTTMGGMLHRTGSCLGENDNGFHAGGFNSDNRACEGHAVQGPNDNTHYRGGCINK